MKNNLKVYFWIMGILAVLVVGMVVANAMVSKKMIQKQVVETKLTATPTPDGIFKGKVMAPVGKELLLPVYSKGGTTAGPLILNLPEGTKIRAGIAGEVLGTSPGPGGEGTGVQIRGEKGLVVSYLFTGTSIVKAQQGVVAGEIIGQIEKVKAPSCLGTGNMGMYISDELSGLAFSLDQLEELPIK